MNTYVVIAAAFLLIVSPLLSVVIGRRLKEAATWAAWWRDYDRRQVEAELERDARAARDAYARVTGAGR